VKQFIKIFFISIISVVLLAYYIPVQSKQSPSCECCKSSTCGCGCAHNSTSSQTLHTPDTPQGKRACDFNKCNDNLPFNTSASVFVTSSFTESTKKLGSSIGLNIVKEVIYPSISFPEKPLFIGHLLSPPPAFLLNSCFIL
jgi:hypothetical protein